MHSGGKINVVNMREIKLMLRVLESCGKVSINPLEGEGLGVGAG